MGDVVREFADSMRRYGLKVGFYMSPADENQFLDGVYANWQPAHAADDPDPGAR